MPKSPVSRMSLMLSGYVAKLIVWPCMTRHRRLSTILAFIRATENAFARIKLSTQFITQDLVPIKLLPGEWQCPTKAFEGLFAHYMVCFCQPSLISTLFCFDEGENFRGDAGIGV